MSGSRSSGLVALLLWGMLVSSDGAASNSASIAPSGQSVAVSILGDFTVDAARPGVVHPPAGVRSGDLLWIRPLRLNADEYLILQRCVDTGCGKAQVVRAWNAYGYMGPYPVVTDKVTVQAGSTYMLWLQRVPTKAGESFRLYDRDAPPLVFEPAGSADRFAAANLKAAREHGPAHITTARREADSFVVTFEGGSVVRMQALRAGIRQAMTNP